MVLVCSRGPENADVGGGSTAQRPGEEKSISITGQTKLAILQNGISIDVDTTNLLVDGIDSFVIVVSFPEPSYIWHFLCICVF